MTVYKIYTPQDLANIANDMRGEYHLMNDIDLSEWGEWTPIRTFEGMVFEGILRGNGYCIKNITITKPSYSLGLFAGLNKATIKNVEVRNMSIDLPEHDGSSVAGGIAAHVTESSLQNCKFSGTMSNVWIGGGIVGVISQSKLSKCETDVVLSCSDAGGGLVGHSTYGTYEQCFTNGEITSGGSCGGIIGNSYVDVINNCYSHTAVSSTEAAAGGVIGAAYYTDSILCCYATGWVTGERTGGLIGEDDISNEYAVITNNYYDSETTGMSDTIRATPKSTEEMMKQATFKNWNFKKIWRIEEGVSYPYFINEKSTQCESISMTRLLV